MALVFNRVRLAILLMLVVSSFVLGRELEYISIDGELYESDGPDIIMVDAYPTNQEASSGGFDLNSEASNDQLLLTLS